jgi:hypothetical protein
MDFWASNFGSPEQRFFARDRVKILQKLREVAPRPTRDGMAKFAALRLQREEEARRAEEEAVEILREAERRRAQEAAAQRRDRERQAEEARRQQGEPADWRRTLEDFLRSHGARRPHWSEVLGLPRTATLEQVMSRWRALALRHHPDRGGDDAAFRRVTAALEEAESELRAGAGR